MKATRAGTKMKIQSTLARHAEIMAALEADGWTREAASQEAMRQIKEDEILAKYRSSISKLASGAS